MEWSVAILLFVTFLAAFCFEWWWHGGVEGNDVEQKKETRTPATAAGLSPASLSTSTSTTPAGQCATLPSAEENNLSRKLHVYHHAMLIEPHQNGQGLAHFLGLIASAKKRLRLATLSLFGEAIMARLIEAVGRGVTVQLIADKLDECVFGEAY